VGLEFFPDIPSALASMTRVGRAFEPIPANQAI
jgi:hypothetical protein